MLPRMPDLRLERLGRADEQTEAVNIVMATGSVRCCIPLIRDV